MRSLARTCSCYTARMYSPASSSHALLSIQLRGPGCLCNRLIIEHYMIHCYGGTTIIKSDTHSGASSVVSTAGISHFQAACRSPLSRTVLLQDTLILLQQIGSSFALRIRSASFATPPGPCDPVSNSAGSPRGRLTQMPPWCGSRARGTPGVGHIHSSRTGSPVNEARTMVAEEMTFRRVTETPLSSPFAQASKSVPQASTSCAVL